MVVRVLKGSKREIAEGVAGMVGEVREAIVFIEETSEPVPPTAADVFAEMEPFSVSAGGADYTREGLYSRTDGE